MALTGSERTKRWYDKHRDEHLARRKVQRKERRARAFELVGSCCAICGKEDRSILHFHKKDGKPHPSGDSTVYLLLKNPEHFVPLCNFPCHVTVTWCMNTLSMTWEDIISRVRRH